MKPGDLRLQPGIGIMLYFATLFGFRAKMLDRASIADVRRRPIPNLKSTTSGKTGGLMM
jgi:hypothetical protein